MKIEINFLFNVNLFYVSVYVLDSHVEVRNNLQELIFSFHHMGLGVKRGNEPLSHWAQPGQIHPFTYFDVNSLRSFRVLVSPRYATIKRLFASTRIVGFCSLPVDSNFE